MAEVSKARVVVSAQSEQPIVRALVWAPVLFAIPLIVVALLMEAVRAGGDTVAVALRFVCIWSPLLSLLALTLVKRWTRRDKLALLFALLEFLVLAMLSAGGADLDY